jgi:hypothetical protein
MRGPLTSCLCLAFLLAAACGSGGQAPVDGGADDAAIPDQPSFESDVKPITVAHCVKCHNATKVADVTDNTRPPNGVFDQFSDPPGCVVSAPMYDAQWNIIGSTPLGPCKGFSDYVGSDTCDNLIACYYVTNGIMPPSTEPQLSAREIEILRRWLLLVPAKP